MSRRSKNTNSFIAATTVGLVDLPQSQSTVAEPITAKTISPPDESSELDVTMRRENDLDLQPRFQEPKLKLSPDMPNRNHPSIDEAERRFRKGGDGPGILLFDLGAGNKIHVGRNGIDPGPISVSYQVQSDDGLRVHLAGLPPSHADRCVASVLTSYDIDELYTAHASAVDHHVLGTKPEGETRISVETWTNFVTKGLEAGNAKKSDKGCVAKDGSINLAVAKLPENAMYYDYLLVVVLMPRESGSPPVDKEAPTRS